MGSAVTRARRSGVLALAGAVAATLMAVAGSAAAVADKDCGDFDTQKAAQAFFLDHGGPDQDPHQLDADSDGVACESNPCPCSSSTGGADDGDEDGPQVLRQRAKVVRVVDGDTVKVDLRPGPKRTVRLLGIDTPEVFGGVECGGEAASKKTTKLLPKGTRVRLVSDPSQDRKDRYGRLLRYVSKGAVDVNRRLVRSGRARVYVYAHHPFRRVKSYRVAQRHAKEHDKGIWGSC